MTATVRVKICGITRAEDAEAAVLLGADALGFNFWPRSKRYCPPEQAREIIAGLPPFVAAVGVFVNAPRTHVRRVARLARLAAVQLHGDEPPAFCAEVAGEAPRATTVIKALQVSGRASLAALGDYADAVETFLLDTASAGYGGSGQAFDWRLARGVAKARRIILAGGLDAANVAAAVRQVRPYAVDVASGVESAPGIKDARKMKRFISAAKEA